MATPKKRNAYPIVKSLVAAIIVAVVVKLFLIDIVTVTGTSMKPTIPPGTMLYVNRLAYGFQLPLIDKHLFFWKKPAAGDIVVFTGPDNGKHYVKRCIAAGPEINSNNIQNNPMFNLTARDFPEKKAVKESILVIGDNYLSSHDSRDFGLIPAHQVIGKVILFTVPRRNDE